MNLQVAANPDQGMQRTAPGLARREVSVGANVTSIAANGDRICAALGDGRVIEITAEGVAEIARHRGAATHVVIDPGGSVLSCGQDGVLHATGSHRSQPLFEQDGAWINALVQSADRRRTAIAVEKKVIIFQDGQVVARFEDHPSTVSGLAFMPDGSAIAASRYNGITLWGLDDLSKPVNLKWAGSMTSASVSPNGCYVAGATQDREIHVWDLVSGRDFRLGGYQRKVKAIGWSSDTSYLYTTGADVLVAWGLAGDPGAIPPVEIGYAFSQTVTAVSASCPTDCMVAGFSDGSLIVGEVRGGTAKIARPGTGHAITSIAAFNGGAVAYGTACGTVGVLDLGLVQS